jgi:HK97 family phage major capsid protein
VANLKAKLVIRVKVEEQGRWRYFPIVRSLNGRLRTGWAVVGKERDGSEKVQQFDTFTYQVRSYLGRRTMYEDVGTDALEAVKAAEDKAESLKLEYDTLRLTGKPVEKVDGERRTIREAAKEFIEKKEKKRKLEAAVSYGLTLAYFQQANPKLLFIDQINEESMDNFHEFLREERENGERTLAKVTTPMSIGSPVAEASVKPENSVPFQSVSEKVRLIATWIPATRQVLDDFTELMGFLQSTVPYYIDLEEELQLLGGDNTGENLHGLIPQAASFNSALLPSAAKGWNKIDVIATAIRQINAAKEIDPTFVIMHTNDWWDIRLTKDGFGRYILGDPQVAVRPNIFTLDVVPTTSIAQGTFLVGSGSPVAAEIRDRMEMQVEISTEHSDYFTRNLIAVRAEKRLALITKRANSFVSGSFSTSP